MFNKESGMKEMILEKLLELFQTLPDGGESEDKPKVESAEMSIEIEPKDKAML